MAFLSEDVRKLLHNRFIVVIGDSIQRGIYKDIVLLLNGNRYLTEQELKNKGEYNFLNDELIEGGRKGEMCNGINYTEVRQYQTDNHLVRFYFITRCYSNYLESILSDLQKDPLPDILIINSCLWDITRYGRDAINEYKDNLEKVFQRFAECLPKHCLVLWNTTLPISPSARGGFLVPEIEFMTSTLRLDIIEANYFAQSIAMKHGHDVLDLHFYLRHHLHRRVRDGIHWDMLAHRYITNLILTHICSAWHLPMQSRRPVLFEDLRSFIDTKRERHPSPKKQNHGYFQFGSSETNNFHSSSARKMSHLEPHYDLNMGSYTWQPYSQDPRGGRVMREHHYRHQPYRHRHNSHYYNY
ncbi:PC-esterase domain-containing protein 1A-like [Biomphalaria glabrata]|uniref:PC-esterase domain-containing protein 1A-like n=1 Tax=Biomphalaria glabrata TaxID=6526 RepID=A0A9W2ZNP4_BIOGL|nr:PC-esterase domain-containing protein 1A-like [Biomphalaria glabrata]